MASRGLLASQEFYRQTEGCWGTGRVRARPLQGVPQEVQGVLGGDGRQRAAGPAALPKEGR